jgi:hypothetical protein
MGAWRQFLDAWEDHQIEVDEYRELDRARVLVHGSFRARGKASGVDLEPLRPTGATVFHIRDGQVIKLVVTSTENTQNMRSRTSGSFRKPALRTRSRSCGFGGRRTRRRLAAGPAQSTSRVGAPVRR